MATSTFKFSLHSRVISWLCFSLAIYSSELKALTWARLLNLSETKHTAIFNLGPYEGMKAGDYGVVVKQIEDLKTQGVRLIPLARGRIIKVTSTGSIWMLFKIFDPLLIKQGEAYLLLSESQMLSGRRNPSLGRLGVVTYGPEVTQQVMDVLKDESDPTAKLKTQYPEVKSMHQKEYRSRGDGELLEVEKWEGVKKNKYRSSIYKSPHQEEFQRQLRLSTFEKMVTNYLKRVNQPDFNYDQFYEEQMKSPQSLGMRERSSFATEYESFLAQKVLTKEADSRFYQEIFEKGESWSESYSDEELKIILQEVSGLQERDRRTYLAQDQKRFTTYLSWGMNLSDSQTTSDTNYRRETTNSYEWDFEGIPIADHPTLQRFTLNAAVRINQGATETGGKNASIDELSGMFGAQWYPLYAPWAIQAPCLFIGTYIRSGSATVKAPSLGEKANYTVFGFPGFRGGMKYNFKNNLGLRLALSMETLTLNRYEQSSFSPTLPSNLTFMEAKMNVGLAYSF